VGDDEVLLNPTTGMYHMLNPAGREIVGRLEDGATVEEAAQALASGGRVDLQVARADADEFIREMIHRGLLEVTQ
jgi:hypothetical protein